MPEGSSGTFSQSPAAQLFSTLYGRVQNYVKGAGYSDVQTIAKEGINDAIKLLNTRLWSWARVKTDITLVAGESGREYALNGAFKAPRSAELVDSGSKINGTLFWIDPKTFDELLPDRTARSDPARYTIFNVFDNGFLTLDGAPSTAFIAAHPTLRLRFYRRTNLLSSDADTVTSIGVPTEFEPFLVWHARMVVAAHWDEDKFEKAERMAERWWQALKRDDGRVETSDWTQG